ncbi:MAG: four helix bundle protein [Patescibacteria group bacterium]|jgi:hypothetical protein
MSNSIKDFTDLETWWEAQRLLLEIYKTTEDFPKDELFGLVSQIRRASVSVTSNIAEGFSRYSLAEKTRFYNIAYSSVVEVYNQLIAAKDLGYIKKECFEQNILIIISVKKLINGLIKSLC